MESESGLQEDVSEEMLREKEEESMLLDAIMKKSAEVSGITANRAKVVYSAITASLKRYFIFLA